MMTSGSSDDQDRRPADVRIAEDVAHELASLTRAVTTVAPSPEPASAKHEVVRELPADLGGHGDRTLSGERRASSAASWTAAPHVSYTRPARPLSPTAMAPDSTPALNARSARRSLDKILPPARPQRARNERNGGRGPGTAD